MSIPIPRERFVNADRISWPRPRRDRDREPHHLWARMEDRKADTERAREWERQHRDDH
jgi:hypothetical protein